ncbi:MAG: S8 family serine peptidase, partial [Hyphomicrobium sp.]
AGMSEQTAVATLRAELPEAHFGPNHVYRIQPAADAKERVEPAAAARTEADGDVQSGCAGQNCFAERLIGWKSSLKRCAVRVRIGLIDTSFDLTHPAFAGRKWPVGDFTGAAKPAKSDWHGTAVLSVLAAQAQSTTPGLVPDADYLLASTFGADSDGNAAADAMSVLKALAWLDKGKADIVNMSFSGPRNDEIEAAIANMAAKGVVFVAAAGNRGHNGPASYPAAYAQVIAVTAVSKDQQSYRHANHGDYVDVSAPGVAISTALPNGEQGYRTGTSFAAPFVTGLLAAMPAARKGALTKADVLSRVSFKDLGAPGRDPVYGEGLPVAPERCNEIGGVASLPWTTEAKRMSIGAPPPPAPTRVVPVSLARPAAQ